MSIDLYNAEAHVDPNLVSERLEKPEINQYSPNCIEFMFDNTPEYPL